MSMQTSFTGALTPNSVRGPVIAELRSVYVSCSIRNQFFFSVFRQSFQADCGRLVAEGCSIGCVVYSDVYIAV